MSSNNDGHKILYFTLIFVIGAVNTNIFFRGFRIKALLKLYDNTYGLITLK